MLVHAERFDQWLHIYGEEAMARTRKRWSNDKRASRDEHPYGIGGSWSPGDPPLEDLRKKLKPTDDPAVAAQRAKWREWS